jgi:hypothetical protein
MREWKWEDAALKPPLSSVERDADKIASVPAGYIKGDEQHSHTRTSAETLAVSGENRATRPALHTQHTLESPSTPRAPDSECRVSFVRAEILSFAPETPGFLPPCECASVGPGLLYTAPEPAQRDHSTTSASIIARCAGRPRRLASVPSLPSRCPVPNDAAWSSSAAAHFCTSAVNAAVGAPTAMAAPVIVRAGGTAVSTGRTSKSQRTSGGEINRLRVRKRDLIAAGRFQLPGPLAFDGQFRRSPCARAGYRICPIGGVPDLVPADAARGSWSFVGDKIIIGSSVPVSAFRRTRGV